MRYQPFRPWTMVQKLKIMFQRADGIRHKLGFWNGGRCLIAVDENTLVDGDYKLIIGTTVQYASWTGIYYPNSTSNGSLHTTTLDCTQGCLFDIINDPTEHINIFNDNLSLAKEMNQTLNELKKGYYSNDERGISYCPSNISDCQCYAAINMYNGYWGPSEYLPNSSFPRYFFLLPVGISKEVIKYKSLLFFE